ncbi:MULTISPECIES: glucoamylase family protein [Caldilinea]|uniref:Glycoamylase-like domain-containing protein n=1 Tax=Caldilinea aerophila (strain DSM 14535 / JCM 11387 / NBRC 104270 / STL-6-O1) TaxID=926550 RepID=I0I4V1_CALAS|nr:hypothetical protein CLDAP_22490 [Caldilinea aerophila DSM 14535 = NBRC 104270]
MAALLLVGCTALSYPSTPVPLFESTPSNIREETQGMNPAFVAAENNLAVREVIAYEMKGAFDFFWEQANTDPNSPGYGLVRDRYPGAPGISSIASVGFALTAYPIGVEKGYISHAEGRERASRTLDTLLRLERVEGFFYHFLDMQSGARAWNSEVSTIDTAILMMGVLTAGEYFGGEVQAKAEQLYRDVNWPWFVDESRKMFYMAYRPEKGFEGYWDFYAEQLMLYVLAAGSPTHPTDDSPYYSFRRHLGRYGDGEPFIHSWFGSLFTHQYSHAWIDFRGYVDREGVDWWENSVRASKAHYDFAVDMQERYQTLGPRSWGLSAADGPDGYSGLYGAPPSGYDNRAHRVDDTVPPYAAIGSILFLPKEAIDAMLYYYSIEELKGRYGFVSAYNLSRNWFSRDVIGIDKGIALLMLANYENDQVYRISMNNAHLLAGLDRLQIVRSKR